MSLIEWCKQFCTKDQLVVDIDETSTLFSEGLKSSCQGVISLIRESSQYEENKWCIPDITSLNCFSGLPVSLIHIIHNYNINNFLITTNYPTVIFGQEALSIETSLKQIDYSICQVANTNYYLATYNHEGGRQVLSYNKDEFLKKLVQMYDKLHLLSECNSKYYGDIIKYHCGIVTGSDSGEFPSIALEYLISIYPLVISPSSIRKYRHKLKALKVESNYVRYGDGYVMIVYSECNKGKIHRFFWIDDKITTIKIGPPIIFSSSVDRIIIVNRKIHVLFTDKTALALESINFNESYEVKYNEITYTSCFFDIGRKTSAQLQNFNNYFTWINKLLSYDINLVFYTTSDLHNRFTYTPRDNLQFILLETYPGQERLEAAREAWKGFMNPFVEKDTPEFAVLTHEKFSLLQQTILNNPYQNDTFYWIDAGITKIANNNQLILQIKPTDKIKLMLMNYYSKGFVNQDSFLQACRYCCAAGVFGGPGNLMLQFCQLIKEEGDKSLTRSVFGLEQEYMYRVYVNHPDLFCPTFGDFSGIIESMVYCRKNAMSVKYFHNALADNNLPETIKSNLP